MSCDISELNNKSSDSSIYHLRILNNSQEQKEIIVAFFKVARNESKPTR
jgi:hypothetical protein